MSELVTTVRIYLEDTDAQGIVYHANYLKYCERARTEFLETLGYSLAKSQKAGVYFVVFDMKLKFRRPARLLETLELRTNCTRGSEYRLTFSHEVFRADEPGPLFVAEAVVVTIDEAGKLCPLPAGLLESEA